MDQFHERCPSCGGPVHKVAGRCRHCRADLVALRAAAARAARQAAQAAQAASVAQAQPAPPPAQVGESQPAADGPSRRRLWRLVAAAVGVLILGVGAGALAARLVRTSGDGSRPRGAPSLIRDAHGAPSPTARAPAPAPGLLPPSLFAPWFGPGSPPDPDPDHDPGTPDPPAGPRTFGDASAFTSAVAERLCQRMAACGVFDDAASGACRALVGELVFAEGLTSAGKCHYDARQAGACIDAIGGIRCDAAGADPRAMLALADLMSSCSQAFRCD